jgi:tRNA-specific 2-thiouridylase
MSSTRTGRVVVGMSGGVDSSVAALLLRDQGYEVHGLFMQNWDEDDTYCDAAADFQEARAQRGARHSLHRVNFAAEYRARVFEHFLAEHRAGRTPNPDVLCNREIKFGAFLAYAQRLGAEQIATGHYARVQRDAAGVARLYQGRDRAKDQSYFLHAVPQAALQRTLFPLGDMQKSEVRAAARRRGLANFDRRDSTGICFIGERPFRRFLSGFLPEEPGPMCTPDGATVGTHMGLAYYTLGQRRGLGLCGTRDGPEAAWFVVGKDTGRNVLVVVQGDAHPDLYTRTVTATQPHWIAGAPSQLPLRCAAKVRYRQADQACTIVSIEADRCEVRFDEAQRAVTPGQYVVSTAARNLGGAVITDRGRPPNSPRSKGQPDERTHAGQLQAVRPCARAGGDYVIHALVRCPVSI